MVAQQEFANLAGKPIAYLEIGIFDGASGCWMLEHILTHPEAAYGGIDSWDWPLGQRYDPHVIETAARERLGRYGDGKVEIIKGRSQFVLRDARWVPGTIDVALIDGSHGYYDVVNDSQLVWPLIRPGGFVAWDDYEIRRVKHSVKKPVDDFLAGISGQFTAVYTGKCLFVRKEQ